MKKLIFCEYNFDNYCVELKFTGGSIVAIDAIAVENEIACNIYIWTVRAWLPDLQRSLEYADLILNGDPETFWKTVAEYKPSDSWSAYRLWENPTDGIFMRLQTCWILHKKIWIITSKIYQEKFTLTYWQDRFYILQ